ncbi:larval-specific very high density lipoprotein [Nomia melanderi]|uniref:larval-specific very high density lipoprotein n=1 Tax=Nomia melanderi TaxID=2448451 RepID=UPI00130474F2|nr:uncharacterized protein LOC116428471 [Nomia melanderi]
MMNALIALLGFLAAVQAVPWYVPEGQDVNYKFKVDMKAGVMSPANFASHVGMDCTMRISRYTLHPRMKNAYYVKLSDIRHQLFNGEVLHSEIPNVNPLPLVDVAKVLENPFVIVFDENGHLHGMKWIASETIWSKNMKKSIASMIQLDMDNIFHNKLIVPGSFITEEKTIHGSCHVVYNVQSIKGNRGIVTKLHEPSNCTNFHYHEFNNIEHDRCQVHTEESMTTVSRKFIDFEVQDNSILIKKLNALGVIDYFPWLANAEAHYLLTNQTLTFTGSSPQPSQPVTDVDIPVDTEITYTKPTENYLVTADLDVTHGRHSVDLKGVKDKLMKLLQEAVNYLKETQVDKHPEWKSGQTINRILYMMSYMNLESMNGVYRVFKHPKTEKDEMTKNIFLTMVPNVGTTAAWLFTRNAIRENTVPHLTAISMLARLPMSLKHPTESLVTEMLEFLRHDENINVDVKKARILCFASLLHRVYPSESTSPDLEKHLQSFVESVHNNPNLDMKLVYLMALKNTRSIKIIDLLKPIINGEQKISDSWEVIRTEAIWSVEHVLVNHPETAHKLLWPILSNVTLPTTLRITAYDVLMKATPSERLFLEMYWFMVYEKNPHLYNYHVDTLKGLASSTDACLLPSREMANKILAFTRIRSFHGIPSAKLHVDSTQDTFGYTNSLQFSQIRNEMHNSEVLVTVNSITTVGRKMSHRWGVRCHVDGMFNVVTDIINEIFGKRTQVVVNPNAKELLKGVTRTAKLMKNSNVNLMLTLNEKVYMVFHCNWATCSKQLMDLIKLEDLMDKSFHFEHVHYHDQYELHIPTDLGVPAILSTQVPVLDAADVAWEKDTSKVHVTAKYQEWRHGEYYMAIYNPLDDIWHAIRRTGTRDIFLPINQTISHDSSWETVTVSSARLPLTEYSIAGLRTQARNYVTISGDETGVLNKSCPKCMSIQKVLGVANHRRSEQSIDSKDTGLHYYSGVTDCDGYVTPTPLRSWMNAFKIDHDETISWRTILRIFLRLQQVVQNDMISSQRASCTNRLLIKPSEVHPAKQVDFSIKRTTEYPKCDKVEVFVPMKMNIVASMDVKSISNDQTACRWNADVNYELSAGHTRQNFKTVLTRMIPGEKNLKVCVTGQQDYPVVDNEDLFNVRNVNPETKTKVTLQMGKTIEDQCVRDEMDVTINAKAELAENKDEYKVYDHLHDICEENAKNPLLQTDEHHVPKTWACVRNAIIRTTLTKYGMDIVSKKLPSRIEANWHTIEDFIRGISSHHVDFDKEVSPVNVTRIHLNLLVSPVVNRYHHTHELWQLPYGNSIWNSLMDNVQFSWKTLRNYLNDNLKLCTVHPKVTLTFDNKTELHEVSQNWEHVATSWHRIEYVYVILTRSVSKNRISLMFAVGEHFIKIEPMEDKVVVEVDNHRIEKPENGVMVPDDHTSFAIKLARNYKHWIIQSTTVPITILYTPNSLTVAMTDIKGQVSGLCGEMAASLTPSMSTLLQQIPINV